MRVRVLKTISAYWDYAVHKLEEGTEHIGDFARHLADNAPPGTVEVLEDDRPDVSTAPVPPEDDGTTPESDQDEEPDAGPQDVEGAPVLGTIDDLMAWVGGDRTRAVEALAAEEAKDKPRSTVVKRLTALAEPDDE